MIELPFLNRRRLLLGLAAASSAAALPVAAIAASGAEIPHMPENAELLRLGDMLPTVAGKYEAALRHTQELFAMWNPLLPRCPVELRQAHGRTDAVERDLSGYGMHDDEGHLVYVIGSDWLTYRRKVCQRALRAKRPRHPLTPKAIAEINDDLAAYRGWETIALDYEAERARVVEASGYAAAKADHRAALEAFGDLVRSMAQPAEGMAGVIVQAQALEAWGTVPLLDQVLATVADKEGVWATRFASAVLRIASA